MLRDMEHMTVDRPISYLGREYQPVKERDRKGIKTKMSNKYLDSCAAVCGVQNAKPVKVPGRKAPEEWEDEAAGVASYDQSVAAQEPVGSDGIFGVVQQDVWQSQADELIAIGELDAESLDVGSFVDERFVDGANDWDRADVEADMQAWADANM